MLFYSLGGGGAGGGCLKKIFNRAASVQCGTDKSNVITLASHDRCKNQMNESELTPITSKTVNVAKCKKNHESRSKLVLVIPPVG